MDTEILFFDIRSYLQDRGIQFSNEGPNTTSGWIEVNCPFCGDDPSFHLGINLTSKLIHCWRCAETGNITKYIQAIEECNFYDAKEILKQYQSHKLIEEPQKYVFTGQVELPKEIDWSYKDQMLEYLRGRNFPDSIVEKYQLAPCGRLGDFKFKIIIPVFQYGELVAYTSRDYTGHAELAKKHVPGIDIKKYLYNLDSVKDRIIICEGPTDVWRLGSGAVATFGIKYTDDQILAIIDKNPKKILIAFDPEPLAQEQAKKLCLKLQHHFSEVYIVDLPEGKDPGDLTEQEAEELRNL
jgi:DNA primase